LGAWACYRCIPIISHLLHIGCEGHCGAEGAQKALILNEFPRIKYCYDKRLQIELWKSGWQYPLENYSCNLLKILMRIKEEKKWLDQFLEQQPVDLIISDNRYGLYSKKVKSIFHIHQLAIQTAWVQWQIVYCNDLNYHFHRKIFCLLDPR
jgi:hypothetical protein